MKLRIEHQAIIGVSVLCLTVFVYSGCSLPNSNFSKVVFDNKQKGKYRYFEELAELKSANVSRVSDASVSVKDNISGVVYTAVRYNGPGDHHDVSVKLNRWHDASIKSSGLEIFTVKKKRNHNI